MDCIKFAGTRKGEVRKTARKAYEKIFAGTEKGERRETVSSRRAYVDTPSDIIKRLKSIQGDLQAIAREKSVENLNIPLYKLKKVIEQL